MSQAATEPEWVTKAECETIREAHADGIRTGTIATERGWSPSTVRYHANGRCRHVSPAESNSQFADYRWCMGRYSTCEDCRRDLPDPADGPRICPAKEAGDE
jgi:hypothetical protein